MNHPGGNKPYKRRYRLNKEKLATMFFVLACAAAFITVAVVSLRNADENITAMAYETSGESEVEGETDKTQHTGVLANRVIVLDAGHGGFDPGAIGVGGTYESELNLAVAQYLKAELENCGAEVIMTREDEEALAGEKNADMAGRRRIIEESGSDIVISIHMNFYEDDPGIAGPVVLFMPGSEQGKTLAETVQQSLNETLHTDGTARSESLYILKSGSQPCVLVECGYLSNAKEEQKLKQPDYQQSVAQAICEGIKQYFPQKELGKS